MSLQKSALSLFRNRRGTLLDYTTYWLIKVLYTIVICFVLIFIVYMGYKSIDLDDKQFDGQLFTELLYYSPAVMHQDAIVSRIYPGVVNETFFSHPDLISKQLDDQFVMPTYNSKKVQYIAANITIIPSPGSTYHQTSVYLNNPTYLHWYTLYKGGFTSGKGSYIYSHAYFPITIYPQYEQALMHIEVLVPK